MPEKQRVTLLKGTLDDLNASTAILKKGELCLIDSNENGYDSLVIGDGIHEARLLKLIPLNVSQGSVFLGIANIETDPGIPQNDVFYITGTEGTYTNFGGIIINKGEIVFLVYRYESWNKVVILTIDSELDETSENPVQNKIVTAKLKELEGKMIHTIKVNGTVQTKTNGAVDLRVDASFSDVSENPIMNSTITAKFNEFNWYEGKN